MTHTNTLFDLSEKIAVVTGGSRGLGLEIATALGEAGATVVVIARRQSWLSEAERQLSEAGIDAMGFVCDVSDPEHVNSTVARIAEKCGRIDILVNNAGISWGASIDTHASR